MNKICLIAAFALTLSPALAVTKTADAPLPNVQAQIAALQQQVAALQKQVETLKSTHSQPGLHLAVVRHRCHQPPRTGLIARQFLRQTPNALAHAIDAKGAVE